MSWWEEEIKSREAGANYAIEKRKKRKGIISQTVSTVLEKLGLKNPEEEDEGEFDEDYSWPQSPEARERFRKKYKRYQEFMGTYKKEIPKMGEKTFKVVDK